MLHFALEQGSSLTTLLLVAAGCLLLTGLFYFRAFGQLRPWQWQTLLALRAAAILLVLLLLFRPTYSFQKELTRKPGLVFLLDRSASMGIADGAAKTTRFEQARSQIERWWEKLKKDFDLRLIEFSEHARLLESVEQLKILTPDGKATSLASPLLVARALPHRRDVEAVVLFSDGLHNTARNPVEISGKLGMTVDTIGVGSSLRDDVSYRDVQVTGIACPDRLLVNNLARISGSVEAVGLGGRVVQAVLEEDGKPIAEQELTLDAAEGPQQVQFEFRPTVKGRHTYTIKVPPAAEEKITQNNQRSAMALVVEGGLRVFYIEGTLRAEYGALVDRFLAKDPDLEFYALVQSQPNVFSKRTNMSELKIDTIPRDAETIGKFDVFIFGDIDATYLKPEQQELFVKRVREGAGLIMLGGYHSLGPGGYAGTPLGEILPVRLGGREIGQITTPFLPQLTPEGVRHPIFANIAEFFPRSYSPLPLGEGPGVRANSEQNSPHPNPLPKGEGTQVPGLPPLDGCTKVEGPRPAASVLAVYPDQSPPMPVLAVQPVGKGRTAVFAGDTTRKWQQGPRALGQESPFLRFWGQLVRWLAGRSEEVATGPGITVSLDKGRYEPEEPIRISATVRDKDGQGAQYVKVTAKIRTPPGKPEQVLLMPEAGPAGRYAGVYEPEVPGPFEFIVEAQLKETTLTSEKLTAEVGRPNLEFERLDLDEPMLKRIAAAAKGRYLHITTADLLLDQLNREKLKRTQYVEGRLYNPPLFWFLFVGVLTTEWILRRKYQLR
ncbi:MAG: VWA domain-containing protein [Pirellulales bacterium]|nr:VWA domain-containing protein [Pirellulales bacterium]